MNHTAIISFINEHDEISSHKVSNKFFPNKPIDYSIKNFFIKLCKEGYIEPRGYDKVDKTSRFISVYKILKKIPEDLAIRQYNKKHYYIVAEHNINKGALCLVKEKKIISFNRFFIENNKIIFNDYLRASIQKEIIENKIDKKFTVKIIEYYE